MAPATARTGSPGLGAVDERAQTEGKHQRRSEAGHGHRDVSRHHPQTDLAADAGQQPERTQPCLHRSRTAGVAPVPAADARRAVRSRWRGREAFGLEPEHLRVRAIAGHQLLVGALLHHPATVEDRDRVRLTHGGEPVRDDDGGQALGKCQEVGVEPRLRAGVQVRRRLVQDEYGRAVPDGEQRPGEADLLPLPAGQVDAAVVRGRQRRLPAPRQAGDRLGDARGTARRLDPRPVTGVVHPSESHVRVRGQGKPGRVLEHAGQPMAPWRRVEPGQVPAVDAEPSASGLVHPAEQFDQGRLAGAVRAHDGERTPGRDDQVQVVQDVAGAARIGERHPLEADLVGRKIVVRQRLSRRPDPRWRAVLARWRRPGQVPPPAAVTASS